LHGLVPGADDGRPNSLLRRFDQAGIFPKRFPDTIPQKRAEIPKTGCLPQRLDFGRLIYKLPHPTGKENDVRPSPGTRAVDKKPPRVIVHRAKGRKGIKTSRPSPGRFSKATQKRLFPPLPSAKKEKKGAGGYALKHKGFPLLRKSGSACPPISRAKHSQTRPVFKKARIGRSAPNVEIQKPRRPFL
jgi:hypothetical protein